MACEYLDKCDFFLHFGKRQSNVWKGMFGYYCRGIGFKICDNRKKFLQDGKSRGYHLMPTGKAVPKSFLDLP